MRQRRLEAAAPAGLEREPGLGAEGGLLAGERACCCPAVPAVAVMMPANAGRSAQVDLLLCRHHFRISRQALAASGAMVIDRTGMVVADWLPG